MPILRVLKSRPALSNTNAARAVDCFAHLVSQFGSPVLPRVPTVFQRFEPIHATMFDDADSRTTHDWAQDTFGRVLCETRMDDWTLSCRPWPEDDGDGLHIHSLASQWHPKAPGSFAVDVLGHPVVLYKEEWLRKPGMFSMHVMLQLATLRLVSSQAPADYDPNEHFLFVTAMAVLNGHGLELLAMVEDVVTHLAAIGVLDTRRAPIAQAHVAFLTVLAMSVRGLAPEQMIASYGPSLTRSFRKAVWPNSEQVGTFAPELKLMRLMVTGEASAEKKQSVSPIMDVHA